MDFKTWGYDDLTVKIGDNHLSNIDSLNLILGTARSLDLDQSVFGAFQ
jgi:hypothetical protein